MSENTLVCMEQTDVDQNIRIAELEKQFDLLRVQSEEREKAAQEKEKIRENTSQKIDWGAQLRMIATAVVLAGGFMGLYMSDALDPLEDAGINYDNRLTILEQGLAVASEKISTAEEDAIEAAEKLVRQQGEIITGVATRKEALRDKVEAIEERVNQSILRDDYEEKTANLVLQIRAESASLQSLLSEDIERIGNEEAETQKKLDALEAALAGTLKQDDFERRFAFISEQREQDLAFISEQREQDNLFQEKQRDQDQKALLRIVQDRITQRIKAIEDRFSKLEDRFIELLTQVKEKVFG